MSNWWILFLIALVPMIVGAVYYHPKVAGGTWMRLNGFTEESLAGGNMLLIFGLTYLFSLFVAGLLGQVVIHQTAISGLFGMLPEFTDPTSALSQSLDQMDADFGLYTRHRSFGHGALHGGIFGLFFVGSIIAINGLFERRNWKYILVHVGYWFLSLVLMGGLLGQFLIL